MEISNYNNLFEYLQSLTLQYCFICDCLLEPPARGKMGKTLIIEIFDVRNNLIEDNERICDYCFISSENETIFEDYNSLQRQRYTEMFRMGLVR